MQKYDVGKFIMANALIDVNLAEKPSINRVFINGLVDGWNNNVYFQPKEVVRINHYIPRKYNLM